MCDDVQMSTLDAFSDLSTDVLMDTALHVNSVSHSKVLVRKAPVAHGEKPVVLMMPEDHQSPNYLGNGSFDQPDTVLSGDCTSMDGTLDSVSAELLRNHHPLVTLDCDLMTTHPSIASRLEKMKTLTSQISSVSLQDKEQCFV